MNYNSFFNPYYMKYNNSYYNYCPPITYNMVPDSYNYALNQNNQNIKDSLQDRSRSDIKNISGNNAETLKINDVISITEDRISILGIGMNTDDLIILVLLFSLLKDSQKIDYALVVVLGILLFSQDWLLPTFSL